MSVVPVLLPVSYNCCFSDIHSIIDSKVIGGNIHGFLFTEIFYADDTLLVFKTTRETHIILKEIEKSPSYYNMNLNKDKCDVIAMQEGKKDHTQ